MIYHPAVLAPKIVVLILLIALLFVLHRFLSPGQFHVAVLLSVVLFACFVIVLWIVVARMLCNPDSNLAKQMVLSSQQRAEDGYQAASQDLKSLVGQCGAALTPLRPSGTAMFGDQRMSVVAEGEFIERDARVEVIAVQGSRVVVRRATVSSKGKSGETA